jgi:hypothetical protein
MNGSGASLNSELNIWFARGRICTGFARRLNPGLTRR